MELTVTETAEANADDVGKVFVVAPRQLRDKGGMCKIGRSTGDEFKGTRGVSLSKDPSVSTWHGKVRPAAVWVQRVWRTRRRHTPPPPPPLCS